MVFAVGGLVDGPGHQPLAGSGLTGNDDRAVRIGNLFNQAEYFTHFMAFANDVDKGTAALLRFVRCSHF